MYPLLRRYLPRVAADILIALWYAVLVYLTLYCAFEPQAEFNYLRL